MLVASYLRVWLASCLGAYPPASDYPWICLPVLTAQLLTVVDWWIFEVKLPLTVLTLSKWLHVGPASGKLWQEMNLTLDVKRERVEAESGYVVIGVNRWLSAKKFGYSGLTCSIQPCTHQRYPDREPTIPPHDLSHQIWFHDENGQMLESKIHKCDDDHGIMLICVSFWSSILVYNLTKLN